MNKYTDKPNGETVLIGPPEPVKTIQDYKPQFLTMEGAKAICTEYGIQYRTDGDKLEVRILDPIMVGSPLFEETRLWFPCPHTRGELLALIY